MTKKHRVIVVFLVFLLIVVSFGVFIKSQQQQQQNPEKLSESPSDNEWLFPDCPGITAKFLDLHPDFKVDRNLLKKWVDPFFLTFWGIKEWLENGIRSDESDFVRWILFVESEKITDFSVKVKYKYPTLLKEIISIDELRNKYKAWKESQ